MSAPLSIDAARVELMLRVMYGASLSASLGRTENCCTSSG